MFGPEQYDKCSSGATRYPRYSLLFLYLYGIGLLPFPEGKSQRSIPGRGIIGTAQGQIVYSRGRLHTGAFATPICRLRPRQGKALPVTAALRKEPSTEGPL